MQGAYSITFLISRVKSQVTESGPGPILNGKDDMIGN